MHFLPLLYAATQAVLYCGMEIPIAFIYACGLGSYMRVKPFAGR